MCKFKRFLSLTLLVIGGLIAAFMLSDFSFAQNYGLIQNNLLEHLFSFRMPNNPVNLYAITEPNTYNIIFSGNGSTSGSMDNMAMIYNQKSILLANKFEREGYVFKGWSSSESGVVEYLDQAEVKNLTWENLGKVILYAHREGGVPYVIEYYQENIDGTGYYLLETGAAYGSAGIEIVLTGKVYTGFTLQTGNEISIISGGSVPYYYKRNIYSLIVKDRDKVLIDTGIRYGVDIPLPADPEWTGNTFLGWDNISVDGKMPANNLIISSMWNYGQHTITFDTNGGVEIDPITMNYGEIIKVPANPTKEGYEFVGWYPEVPATMPYDDITVTAIWKEVNKVGGWSGGGRGGQKTSSAIDVVKESVDDYMHNAADVDGKGRSTGLSGAVDDIYSPEFVEAFNFARNNGLTTKLIIQNAEMDKPLTRIAMAKMLSYYAINILGKKPDTTKKVKFRDVTNRMNKQYNDGVTLAYQLGIMGINMQDNKFRPNDIVTRAEFVTALSRLLYNIDDGKYKGTGKYYTPHMAKLYREGIITKTDPNMEELRGYVMIMLMRTAK